MQRSPFSSLLLPALLTSMAAFTVLTLTLPRLIGFVAVQSQRVETQTALPALVVDSRSTVVRYVGFSVILSVGVGLITIEGLRKWQAFHDSALIKAEELGLLSNFQALGEVSESSWSGIPLELDAAAMDEWAPLPSDGSDED